MIQNTTLSTGDAANIFVGAGSTGSAVSTMYFCNNTNAATTFNMYVVPAGVKANNTNIVYVNKLIAAYDTYIMDMEKLFLSPNETICANANVGGSIVATVSSIGI